jgi:uncharacterized protein (TIGR02646 family)
MFCLDSRGVDIDHFWPKSQYPERTFAWDNLMLVCAGCNRRKSDRFGLDTDGVPMLIDPTRDDPWDYLYYDSRTGILTARFAPTGEPAARGFYTVESSNLPLNIQAVTDGRLRAQRNLERCIHRFLQSANASNARDELVTELRSCLDDNDDYGLRTWFVLREGRDEGEFAELRSRFPEVWTELESFTAERERSCRPTGSRHGRTQGNLNKR